MIRINIKKLMLSAFFLSLKHWRKSYSWPRVRKGKRRPAVNFFVFKIPASTIPNPRVLKSKRKSLGLCWDFILNV